jgi:hypothetical protein
MISRLGMPLGAERLGLTWVFFFFRRACLGVVGAERVIWSA